MCQSLILALAVLATVASLSVLPAVRAGSRWSGPEDDTEHEIMRGGSYRHLSRSHASKVVANRIAVTEDVKTSWSCPADSVSEGNGDTPITADEVRAIVGRSLPISIDPTANN